MIVVVVQPLILIEVVSQNTNMFSTNKETSLYKQMDNPSTLKQVHVKASPPQPTQSRCEDIILGAELLNDDLYRFKCKVEGCGKAFRRKTSAYNHRVLVHGQKDLFKCEHDGCERAFALPSKLKRHQKIHEGYYCKLCPEKCDKWTELRKHVSQAHPIEHACAQCQKSFKRPHDLRRHILTHQNIRAVFVCPEETCEKVYDRVATLRKHIKAQHHQELPFKCPFDECPASFPRKQDLEKHVKYHVKKEQGVKKSYPKKGHRRISTIERLLPGPPSPSNQLVAMDSSPHELCPNSESPLCKLSTDFSVDKNCQDLIELESTPGLL